MVRRPLPDKNRSGNFAVVIGQFVIQNVKQLAPTLLFTCTSWFRDCMEALVSALGPLHKTHQRVAPPLSAIF